MLNNPVIWNNPSCELGHRLRRNDRLMTWMVIWFVPMEVSQIKSNGQNHSPLVTQIPRTLSGWAAERAQQLWTQTWIKPLFQNQDGTTQGSETTRSSTPQRCMPSLRGSTPLRRSLKFWFRNFLQWCMASSSSSTSVASPTRVEPLFAFVMHWCAPGGSNSDKSEFKDIGGTTIKQSAMA